MVFDPKKMAIANGTGFPAEWNALTERVIGCAIEVHRHLGPGLREKMYEQALVIELRRAGLRVGQQRPFRVRFRGEDLGTQIVDPIVEDCLLLETKSTEQVTETDEAQLLGYLRFTGLPLGLILNFKRARLSDGIIRKINWPPAPRSPEVVVDHAPFSVPSVSAP